MRYWMLTHFFFVQQQKSSHRASASSASDAAQLTPNSAGPHSQQQLQQQQALAVSGLQSPPEFLAQSAALASEFSNFQGDIFSFGNETFNIDNNWNFDQFWQ